MHDVTLQEWVKKFIKSLIKHGINRKFVCFICKIKLYFTNVNQLLYFQSWICHSWKYCVMCSLGEIYFNLTLKQTNIIYNIFDSLLMLFCFLYLQYWRKWFLLEDNILTVITDECLHTQMWWHSDRQAFCLILFSNYNVTSWNQSELLTQDRSDTSIYRDLKCQPENPCNFKYVFCLYHMSTMILIIQLLIICYYTNILIHNDYYNIPSFICKHQITFILKILIKYISHHAMFR